MKRAPTKPIEVEVMGWVQAELWPRLGFSTVAPIDHKTYLLGLAERVGPGVYSSYLRRLASTPAVLRALNRRPRGAPESARAWNLALHYAVAKELLGTAALALCRVAKVWSISDEKRIKEAYSAHKTSVLGELEKLIDLRLKGPSLHAEREGQWVPKQWTRREILEALNADLTDRAKAQKRSLKKGNNYSD